MRAISGCNLGLICVYNSGQVACLDGTSVHTSECIMIQEMSSSNKRNNLPCLLVIRFYV